MYVQNDEPNVFVPLKSGSVTRFFVIFIFYFMKEAIWNDKQVKMILLKNLFLQISDSVQANPIQNWLTLCGVGLFAG